MGTLTLTKNYADTTVLFASDFDAILDDLETFLNTTKINDDNIQDDGLTGTTVLLDSSVTTAKLASNSITAAKLVDATVATSDVALLAVTTAKIIDSAVTTAELASSVVQTGNVASTSITKAKVLSNYVFSDPSTDAVFTDTAGVFSNLSVEFTVVGNPVEIRVVPTVDAATYGCFHWADDDDDHYPIFQIHRDGVAIASIPQKKAVAFSSTADTFAYGLHAIPTLGPFLDVPGAGTYTYTVKAYWNVATSRAITCMALRMFVREL